MKTYKISYFILNKKNFSYPENFSNLKEVKAFLKFEIKDKDYSFEEETFNLKFKNDFKKISKNEWVFGYLNRSGFLIEKI